MNVQLAAVATDRAATYALDDVQALADVEQVAELPHPIGACAVSGLAASVTRVDTWQRAGILCPGCDGSGEVIQRVQFVAENGVRTTAGLPHPCRCAPRPLPVELTFYLRPCRDH